MNKYHRCLLLILWFSLPASLRAQEAGQVVLPDTVRFRSGKLLLKGVLWKPPGRGPFPVVLYNHGSAPSTEAYDARLAPVFIQRGYAFFLPSRRGQNLSKGVATPIHQRLDSAAAAGGVAARSALVMRLHDSEQLQDQLAGLAALKKQPGIDSNRIAVAGSSFGGIQTMLMATQSVGIKAAVNFAGAAMNWEKSEAIQQWMKQKAAAAKVPVFFVQAENDYSIQPSLVLAAEMKSRGLPHWVKIYPPYQPEKGPGQGHAFWAATDQWSEEVFRFLDQYLKPVQNHAKTSRELSKSPGLPVNPK